MSWDTIEIPKSIHKTKIGRNQQILSADIKKAGRFPVVDQGQEFIAGYSDEQHKVISDDLPLVIFGDHTRCVKYVDFPFIIGADGTKVLKPDTELFDPKFFYYAVLGLNVANRGYNRHFTLLKSIPRPAKEEQRKIASVLGLVQRAIEQQERLIALTTELKKALLHKLFTEGLRGEPQKQTEIGPVPESWAVTRLRDFCILQRGFDITKKEQVPGDVPVVSSGGIASYHHVSKVKGPGVAVGRKGTLGKVHYLDVDYWPHDTTLWVKDFKGHDPLFTAYFLETLGFERFDSGASNPTLNRNTVHGELVAYPEKDEQREIGRILRTVEDKSRVHDGKRNALKDLFRTLLHQLMTAKIRVNDLEILDSKQEPAIE